MVDGPYIAEAAALIGDPARSNILAALMAGRALSAGELSYAAGVAPSTTSEHLKKLVGGRLLSVISSGRNRYYRLASPAVADALESLMALSLEGPPRHRPPTRCSAAMALGRTCFDHLAGRLGVAIADSLVERGLVVFDQSQASLTEPGRAFLGNLGIGLDADRKPRSRRPLCKPCLDWSERRWHIGGAVGAAICASALEFGWIERSKDSRAVTVTPLGEKILAAQFQIQL